MTTQAKLSAMLSVALFASLANVSDANAIGALPQGFTYQGRLFQTNGTTPLTDTVNFTIEIFDPSGTCLLYKEKVSNYNLSPTNGLFSFNVGTPSTDVTKRLSPDPGLSMVDVFSNSYDHTGRGGGCATFNPAVLSAPVKRKMQVTISNVTTGAADVVLSPKQDINTTPYATVAESLQGYGPDKFIKVVGTTTQAAIDSLALKSTELGLLAAQSTKLLALTNGATAGGVLNIGTPTSGTDPVNKNYADGKLGGLTFDVTTTPPTTTGQSIRYNQVSNKWEVYTPSTSAVSGSTLASTGNATIGGNAAITGSATIGTTLGVTGASTFTGPASFGGNVSIGANKWLSLGSFNTSQESSLVGAFTAADAGKVWFNSTTKKMMYFDGTAAVAVGAGGSGGSGTVTSVTSANAYLTVATGTTTPALTLNVGTGAGTVAAGNDSRIVNALPRDGSVAMTGDLDLGGTRKVINAVNPAAPQEVATKNYVDNRIAGDTFLPLGLNANDIIVRTAGGWTNMSLSTLGGNISSVPSSALAGPVAKDKGGTGVDNTSIAQKQFFAGPVSGANAAAAFRGIASTDLPIGTTAGTVAAGDDSRLVNVLQKDGSVAMTGDLNLNGRKIIGGAPPVGASDFATKAYVDAAGGGGTNAVYAISCSSAYNPGGGGVQTSCVRLNVVTGETECSYGYYGGTWSTCSGNPTFSVGGAASGPQDCSIANVAGTLCSGGTAATIFAGIYGGARYMTTPAGCNNSTTPSCPQLAVGGTVDSLMLPFADNTTGATKNYNTSSSNQQSSTDGWPNTLALATNYTDTMAAKFCKNLAYAGYTDWFLPSKGELNMLYTNKASIGGFATGGSTYYWSSTEDSNILSWAQDFTGGSTGQATKTNNYRVRCIRRY